MKTLTKNGLIALSFTVLTACGGGGGASGGNSTSNTASTKSTVSSSSSQVATSSSSSIASSAASTESSSSVAVIASSSSSSIAATITATPEPVIIAPSSSSSSSSSNSSSSSSSSSVSSMSSSVSSVASSSVASTANNSSSSYSSSSSSQASSLSNESHSSSELGYSVGELYAPEFDYSTKGGTGRSSDYRVIGYYMPSLDGSFAPSEIGEAQAKKLTHINYAFIGINANLQCDFINPENAATETATIAELQALKNWNPALKTLFSIGGWAESNDDSDKVERYRAAFEPANREAFVNSCIDFMQEHGFDGIDIDWEYPRAEDVDNFIAGLTLIRQRLDARGNNELSTIAGAGGAFFMSRYYHALPAIVAQLDFINLMSYDLNGPWNGVTKTNFHAHLYGNTNEPRFYNALREASLGLTWEEITARFPSPFALTVDAAIKQHLMMDIPRDKIIMGVPFYGRAFFNTAAGNNGLYQSFNTPNGDPYVGDPSLLVGCDTCTERNEPRIATFAEIQQLIDGDYGYSVHFDEQTKAPWLHHAANNIFVTYDDANSLRYKTDYIKNEGLGGVMFWHLGQDTTDFTLLNSLHTELNGDNAHAIGGQTTSSNSSSAANNSGNSSSSSVSSNVSSSASSSSVSSASTSSASSTANTNTQPGAVNIAWMNTDYSSSSVEIELSWNMYWGENGRSWNALIDDIPVHTASLTPNGQNAQAGSVTLNVSGAGQHTLMVELCNNDLCSSDSKVITLGGASSAASSSSVSSAVSSSSSSVSSSNASLSSSSSASVAVNKTYGEYNNTYEQTSDKVIVSYFVEWGIYGRDYHIQDVPAANITHLLFGFLAICGDNPHASGGAQAAIAQECADKQENEITLVDRFANLEKTYPGDTWYDDVNGQNYNGNFGQMRKLKAQYPHLTILPSVGGWTMSTPFYAMAKDDAKRAVFVESAIRFIKKYDFFDGLDIDWEYPVHGGTDADLSTPADREGYNALMRDLRAAMDELSEETGRTYQLTSAVGAAPEKIEAVDYVTATSYMDYIFLMSYDYMGAWNNTTGHHTPLYDNRNDLEGFNTHDSVQNILNAGVPANKLVVGGAFYGRGWTGTQNTDAERGDLFPIYGQATGPAKGTWEAGVQDYRDLFDNYIGSEGNGINGFEARYDETAEAAYLWNDATGEFITYDSPRSIAAKADYVNQHNLAGMITWELDGDNGHLLNAINEGFGNEQVQ